MKVPPTTTLEAHAEVLKRHIGAESYRLMPAKGIFALGVGHMRRKVIEPGDKADEPAKMLSVVLVELAP